MFSPSAVVPVHEGRVEVADIGDDVVLAVLL